MKQNFKKAFTIIEVLVAVTILSIIMISVMQIYISSSDINLKTDINRAMQENIKNAVETMAEDIRKKPLIWVVDNDVDSCDFSTDIHSSGIKMCIWSDIYRLWKKINDSYTIASNEQCDEVKESGCTILKNGKPLMNSWVDIKYLQFKVSDEEISKVTILMEVQPSAIKWIRPDLIKQNRMDFQTTISQRPDLN